MNRSIVIVYFSGTGNTRYVAQRIFDRIEYSNKNIYSIEDSIDHEKILGSADDIMVLYPIIGGNLPLIMREYLRRYRASFWGKRLITIVTEAGFSGDGGALAHRMLDGDKVTYLASYHIIMPTNVSFGKIFKIKNGEELEPRIKKANRKIDEIVEGINSEKYKKVGSSKLAYLMGYHLQRKYFERIEPKLREKFTVNSTTCIGCLKCVELCPMHNIHLENGKVKGDGNCTLCYRCLHACPTNSITLLRHESTQYRGVEHAR